ncbi:hypothetical protein J7I93_00205 [Bacillus sp. ISL-47]|uniref:hypothetical protein n=1 Tax=Bacillus sp. ISL-47 TaxID=2819130 RepID=UPI001BEC8BC3|nr:hypothetical protein [Bacillus sp. ISL-47]MBT2686597.1 hypothetical protein [Bacillus sp. ISL-47]MBT2706989.1 hypothetical protein [Pseudomonas sp. ISL-84]
MLSNFYGTNHNKDWNASVICEEKEKKKVKNAACSCNNIVNDTAREVAIGKCGVAAGEFASVAIVGKDGAAAAGENPNAANVGEDGTAKTDGVLGDQSS